MPTGSNLRTWVLRTIGNQSSSMNELHGHFTAAHPGRNVSELEEILQNRRDIVTDDNGRMNLTEEARRELEEINRHDASRRVKD